jgi:hypothetical protein
MCITVGWVPIQPPFWHCRIKNEFNLTFVMDEMNVMEALSFSPYILTRNYKTRPHHTDIYFVWNCSYNLIYLKIFLKSIY